MKMPLKECLSGTYFLDTDHPEVIAFTKQNTKERESKLSNIISLYYAIRDGFRYNPYEVILKPEKLKASYLLTKNIISSLRADNRGTFQVTFLQCPKPYRHGETYRVTGN